MVVATVSADGPAVVADGAAQGARRARLRVLHQLRVPQGPRARRPTRTCSLLFPWHDLQRQVRVEGTASRVSPGGERGVLRQPAPRVAARRLGVAAVAGGGVAGRARRAVRRRAGPVRRAGRRARCRRTGAGSASRRRSVEFWQGRKGRMHDRLRYRRAEATRTRRGPWSGSRRAGHRTDNAACE